MSLETTPFRSFAGIHSDFVHDVAYDHYGKRLATCSSDHKVKIWSQGADGEWRCEAELKHHASSVWKLAWAHAEFGQVLASCSFDRNVVIWEEHDVQVLAHVPQLRCWLPGQLVHL